MKNLSKKGFSLLEVMLAVAIMAVASSMIMYGFLASMNYANNTSIYARVAAKNQRGGYYRMANYASQTRGARYANLGAVDDTIKFEGPGYDIDLLVGIDKFEGDFTVGPDRDSAHFNVINGAQGLDAAYGDSLEGTNGSTYAGNTTVADNRTSFFYTLPPTTFPSGTTLNNGRCPVCGQPYTLAMYRRGADPSNTYHWVCENWNNDSPNDHTAYRQQILASWNTYSGT